MMLEHPQERGSECRNKAKKFKNNFLDRLM